MRAGSRVASDQDAVVSEIEIDAPSERVFQSLTESGQLVRWLANPSCPGKHWKMDARLGGKHSSVSERSNVSVNGVNEFRCRGEILEFDPPRLLEYTWISNWHNDPERATTGRWELTPLPPGRA